MKKKIFELNRQLHEQYAINNNSNLGSIIALMTAMLGVLGVFGYIFIYSGINFAPDWGSFYVNGKYSLDVLLFSSIAADLVLLIIFYLSAYIGTNQRLEQFITFAIRIKYYKKKEEEYHKIFPRNYSPFNKTKINFIQGLYGEFCNIIWILFWFIFILTFFKLTFSISYCDRQIFSSAALSVSLFIAATFVSNILFYCIKSKFFNSYKQREEEYSKDKFGSAYKSN
ncbi:MAG: hypothetical protein AB7V36_12780 [Bacteroidales bacterium]